MMRQIPISREDFYKQRDNRTNLTLAQPREPVSVALTISPHWVNSLNGQLALYWLSSLVARMGERYNRTQILLPGDTSNTPCLFRNMNGASFGDVLLSHLRGADPFGSYAVIEVPMPGAFVIAVGDAHSVEADFVIRPKGWSASLTRPGTLSETLIGNLAPNPIGSALSAALGAAAVYYHFNKESLPGRSAQAPLWISAWHSAVTQSHDEAAQWDDGPILPDIIDLGRWLIVGAGALGGNVFAILAALKLQGLVDILDPDFIDISNLNRLIAALFGHIGQPKVQLGSLLLAASGAQVSMYTDGYERLQEYRGIRRLPIETYNLVLTGVDQMATRAFVQSDWPRYIINGGTRNYTWLVSTHSIGSKDTCLGCFAGNSQQNYASLNAPLGCAGGLPAQTQQNAMPMDSYSFVSFFGAAFMAAKALQQVLAPGAASTRKSITDAVALNIPALRYRSEPPSQRCLCRCSEQIVREYRTMKYLEGE
jgi:molybdopterin/thiamine biosynthesis adenylyltransferase